MNTKTWFQNLRKKNCLASLLAVVLGLSSVVTMSPLVGAEAPLEDESPVEIHAPKAADIQVEADKNHLVFKLPTQAQAWGQYIYDNKETGKVTISVDGANYPFSNPYIGGDGAGYDISRSGDQYSIDFRTISGNSDHNISFTGKDSEFPEAKFYWNGKDKLEDGTQEIKKIYTLTYNINGGQLGRYAGGAEEPITLAQKFETGETVDLSWKLKGKTGYAPELPYKENCLFLGWSKNEQATQADYPYEKDKVLQLTFDKSNITLYAVFQDKDQIASKAPRVSSVQLSSSNYTNYIKLEFHVESDTVYGLWVQQLQKAGREAEKVHFSIDGKDYKMNQSISSEDPESFSIDSESIRIFVPTGVEKDTFLQQDHIFKIDFADHDSPTYQYEGKSKTFVAPKVTVTFDLKGGSGTIDPITVEKGESLGEQFPETKPQKEGYTFEGWASKDAAVEADFTKDSKIEENRTVYAVWKEVPKEKVTVTFDLKGGSGTIDPITVEKGESLGEQFPETKPQKEGYTFEGWASKDAAVEADFTKDSKIEENRTVYAVWKEVPKPQPNPGTTPDPKPQPNPGTTPDPKPQPNPGTTPDPKPQPNPGTTPSPKPAPQPAHSDSSQNEHGTPPLTSNEPAWSFWTSRISATSTGLHHLNSKTEIQTQKNDTKFGRASYAPGTFPEIVYFECTIGQNPDSLSAQLSSEAQSKIKKVAANLPGRMERVYDIRFKNKEGRSIQPLPNKKVQIHLNNIPGKQAVAVFHIQGKEAELIPIEKQNESELSFEASSFSPYLVVYTDAKDELPKTGAHTNRAAASALLLTALVTAAWAFSKKYQMQA